MLATGSEAEDCKPDPVFAEVWVGAAAFDFVVPKFSKLRRFCPVTVFGVEALGFMLESFGMCCGLTAEKGGGLVTDPNGAAAGDRVESRPAG